MSASFRFVAALLLLGSLAPLAHAATYTVTNGNNSGAGSLSQAITSANAAGAGPHTITVSASVTTINITSSLPIISTSVTIVGNGTSVVGNNQQLFVVNSGTVVMRDMTISGGKALGGSGGVGSGGGGGGLGAGGGLFVNTGAAVTIERVSFAGNTAQGGNGGATSAAEGGGGGGGFRGTGGAGGNGTNIGGGGGGGGLVGTGGIGSTTGGGGGGGGTTSGSNASGTTGGAGNGGGGKGGNTGLAGTSGSTNGGGGGGGQNALGAAGGAFGGGGGGGGLKAGGVGGFGAGGGGAGVSSTGGVAGFGGGAGGNTGVSGSGGSGFGGAIFVRDGGSLTVIDSSANAANGVTAGTGAAAGQTAGSNLYLMTGVNANFGGTGNSQLEGSIAGDGGLTKTNTGTLTLSGANTYVGGTTVSGGVLRGTTTSLQGNVTNNAQVQLDQNTSGTYAGNMSGTGSLNKTGTGTVTLSGTNNYSGGTTVNAGSLRGTTSSLQGNVTNNANVEFNQSTNGTYAGNMAGTGNLLKSGAGTVTLSGTNTYNGGTTVNAGTLRGTTGSVQGNITNNANVEFSQSGNGAYGGNMSGAGTLTKSGVGTVTLSGTNTYGGGTTVSGGTLRGNTSSVQGNITNNARVEFDQKSDGTYGGDMTGGGSLVKNGVGTVTLGGKNTYSGGTTVNEGALRGTTDTLQGSFENNARVEFDQKSDGTYGGDMAGSGTLVKNGVGTVMLSGKNSYSGGTTVNEGALRGNTDSLQGNFDNNARVEFDQKGDGIYSGDMSGGGSLVKNGAGTVALSGKNSYSGGTTVNEGTLRGTTNGLQGNIENHAHVEFDQKEDGTYAGDMTGKGNLTKNGGGTVTLSGNNSYAGGTTVNEGTLRGTTDSLQGSFENNAHVEFDQKEDGEYTGEMAGKGSLSKRGGGTLTLSGINTYGGGTAVDEGTLRGTTDSLQGEINNNAQVEFDQDGDGAYAGNMAGAGALTKNGKGTVTLSGSNSYSGGTSVGGGTLRGTTDSLQGNFDNNARVEFDQNADGTYAGTISGGGDFLKSGAGIVTLTGPNSYSGGTTVNDGTLRGTTDSLQGNIDNNARVEFDQNADGTYAGAMSGTGSFLKNGSGVVTLTGPNSYGGGTTVRDGTLRGTTDSLQGNIDNNARVEFDQNTDGTYAGNITGAGHFLKSGVGTVTLTGQNLYSAGTTVNDGALRGTTESLQGNIDNNARVEFDQATDGIYSGAMSGTGSLTKNGAGTATLSGVNSYSGGTTVNDGALRGSTDSLQGEVENNARVEFDQNTDGTYAGTMSGAGSLLKIGAGTVTLSGTNTYAGGTTVSAGTLRGTTESLQGNVANNAQVEFNQNTDGAYAGNMSGSGRLTKNGTGTLTMSGSNAYTGGTIVSGGTVRGTTSSLQGNITNNAQVEFDQNADGTYAGNITGTGSFTKNGEGTVTLSGSNTYSGGTTVGDGLLRGTTSSLRGNIDNQAQVEFDQNTSGTYAGLMSGAGSLTKNGTGTLTLSGSNTYSGGTTVSGGTLRGTATSLQGNIENQARVELEQNTDGTYAGNLSGSGSLTKSGAGAVTLSGTNTYSGGTAVNGGSLRGTADSLQGDIENNALVEFEQNTDGTYAGDLFGSGNLLKSGAGLLELTGQSTYSGGTTVSGGTLLGTTTSLQGNFANEASVVFQQSFGGTYAGQMSGSGSLLFTGPGSVELTGLNTYTGTTTVDAGTLRVNGSITSDTLVNAGGALGGSGTIAGSLTSNGTVAPGNSIGTLTVAGTYTQQAGSVLEIEVNDGGTTPGTNNDLIVTQDTMLNGGTVQVKAAAGNYTGGSTYRFLSAQNSLLGQFSGITSNFADFNTVLGYDFSDGLYWAYFTLEYLPTDYAAYAQTANELAVANYLDSISGGTSPDLRIVLDGLNTLEGDPAAMQAAFNTMSGEVGPTLATVGLQNTTLVVQQLAGQLRTGTLGLDSSRGSAAGDFALCEPRGPIALVSYERNGAPRVTFVSDDSYDTWRGWMFGYGLGGSATGDGNAAGLNYGMGGTLLGMERGLGGASRVGFFGGYQGTSLQLDGPVQSGRIDGGTFGSYLYNDDGFNYYSLIGGTQFNGYDTQRLVQYDGINRTADGSFGGWQGYGYLERGVSFRTQRTTLQPYAALQYIYLRQNAYTETGAETLNLNVSGIDANSLRSLIGGRLQYTQATRLGHRLLPEVRALWLHEFLDTDVAVNSFFAPIGGGSFAIQGLDLGRDWAILGGGLRYELDSGWQMYFNYDAQVNTQQVFHVGSGGLQYAW